MTKFAMSVTEPGGQTTTIEFETIEELLTELQFFAGSHSGLKISCDIVTKNDSKKYSVEYNAV